MFAFALVLAGYPLLTVLPGAARLLPPTFCVQGVVVGGDIMKVITMTDGSAPIGTPAEVIPVTATLMLRTAYVVLPISGARERGGLHLTMRGEPHTTPWPWAVADYPQSRTFIGKHVRACGGRGKIEPFRYYVLDVEWIDVLEELLP